MLTRSTKSLRTQDVKADWYVVDATDLVLGRLASQTVNILRGKNKAQYTPHTNCGDHVIIINAEKIAMTGNKIQDRKYFRHTGFAGGIKETNPRRILEGKNPTNLIKLAVKRMITRDSALARDQIQKLHIYTGSEHPHQAQNPKTLDFAAKNRKNKRNK